MAHDRVTPGGQLMGKTAARLADLGLARLAELGLDNVKSPALRDDMCTTCACRLGTVPNGCLQTQLDLLKAASEGVPFMCHAPKDGKLCAGWVRVRAELAANPLPPQVIETLARWDYSSPDEDDFPARAQQGGEVMQWEDLSAGARQTMKFLGNFGPTVRPEAREVKGYMHHDDGDDGRTYLDSGELRSIAADLVEVADWLDKRAQQEAQKQ